MEREKMKRLGATAVPMPLNEVLPSLQRGVIDGTMSGTSVFVAFKFNDVVKIITVTNDTMLVSLAMVSKVWLDKLPPDLRKIVVDVGRETQVRTHKWEQEFSKTLEAKWEEMGGQMHTLPPEDLAKMKTLLAVRRRRRQQGSAGGARHAQEGPRGRGQALILPNHRHLHRGRSRGRGRRWFNGQDWARGSPLTSPASVVEPPNALSHIGRGRKRPQQ